MSSSVGQSQSSHPRRPWILLGIAVLLVLIGGVMAQITQTAGGKVAVRQVHFAGTNGTMMYGLLYIPKGTTSKKPAPGVVAIHGYINSHDTMDGFAIELARRGCVVLAVDQTGHGFSDGPAFANGFGGPDSLSYLRSLSIVDPNNVALIGHSMGGWASLAAAATFPKDYRSLVLVSSSTDTPPFAPMHGTATFPRNTMVVEALHSEFSQLMWGVPKGSDFPNSERLKALFATSAPIVPGQLYGSIADGTGRMFYYPNTTHPGLTFDHAAIAHTVDWIQQTLTGVGTLSANRQIWVWDEIGTLIAIVGVMLVIFPAGQLLLRAPFFQSIVREVPLARQAKGLGVWIGAIVLDLVGILTFFVFQNWGTKVFPASGLFAQTITTGIMTWAVLGGLIGLALFLLWHFLMNRKQGGTFHSYGLTEQSGSLEWANIGKSLLFAMVVLAAPYLLLYFLQWAFATDARIWVFNAKILHPITLRIWLPYFVPFLFYFLVLGMVLHGELRSERLSPGWEMARNVLIMSGGFVVFILVEYVPLFAGGTLLTPSQPLLAIVAFQFVPMYAIITCISTFFFYETGRIVPAAIMNAIFVPLLIVASTATQFPV
ncbi:MAG TPA: alpha/beta fold hydrolase [Spirochaetia bacterium]|nr:alpha/beta fold hydrolase [Spirochaetia bacterium]